MPAAAIKAVDNLLADMDTALRERGPDAKAKLAAACGLMTPSLKNWRVAGRIPDQHRDAVRAWLQAPAAKPPKAKVTKPPGQRRAAKPAAKPAASPPPVDLAPTAPAADSRQLPAPLSLTSIAGSYISYATLLRQLGLDVTFAWVRDASDDGTMRFKQVAVLP